MASSASLAFANGLVEMLLPGGKGVLAMLQAYFDESEHTESGMFCIAGYGMFSHQVRRFNKEWGQLFGARALHMKHLAHSRGEFEGISKDEKDRLLAGAVKIINKRAAFAVVAWCNVQEIRAALANRIVARIPGLENPYSLCHYMCMLSVGSISRKRDAGKVAYIFESGYHSPGAVTQLITEFSKDPSFVETVALQSHTFADKRSFPPLQAADLLAYEWVKRMREPLQPLRRTMRELVACERVQYEAHYLGGHAVYPFMDGVERLAVDQVMENFDRDQQRAAERSKQLERDGDDD